MTGEPADYAADPEPTFGLDGKTAIVTGAASGLGRAIALGFAAQGASVVCADIDEPGARAAAASAAGDVTAVHVDVTDSDSLERLRDRTRTEYGSYDIVCNIPGTNTRKPVVDLPEAEWRDIIDLNLTGVFLAAKTLGEPLVAQEAGSVINMASIRGIDGGPDQSAYSASKGGVIQFTKGLAAEWAPDVRVNALAPGYIKTPLVREAMEDTEWHGEMRDKHMMERFGDPSEVVGGAVYLASDASSFVTGSVLTIDGGWTAQ